MPTATAEAVGGSRQAGYANVGKTNLHEFAYGTTSENPHFGTVPNPLAPGRVAGGSSGGSAAALAAGLADAALGSDTGGSIRIPAACCGVVGFKPTYGLVPLEGCFPLAPSLDHAGPMARSVEECTAMLEALVPGFERASLGSLEEVEVGVAWTEHAEPLVRARVEEAAAALPRPPRGRPPARRGASAPSSCARWQTSTASSTPRTPTSTARTSRRRSSSASRSPTPSTRRGCAPATRTASRWRSSSTRSTWSSRPTLPFVAPPAGQDERELRGRLTLLTWPFNVLGAPALALPCGPAEDGLPASVQIAGPPGDDALVLAAGALLEHALKP